MDKVLLLLCCLIKMAAVVEMTAVLNVVMMTEVARIYDHLSVLEMSVAKASGIICWAQLITTKKKGLI